MLGVKEKFFLIQKNTIEKGPWNCSEGTIWGYHTVAMLGLYDLEGPWATNPENFQMTYYFFQIKFLT